MGDAAPSEGNCAAAGGCAEDVGGGEKSIADDVEGVGRGGCAGGVTEAAGGNGVGIAVIDGERIIAGLAVDSDVGQ